VTNVKVVDGLEGIEDETEDEGKYDYQGHIEIIE